MKVFVIMGNDYPDSVFTDEAAADAYCEKKTKQNKVDMERGDSRRIYWRSYPFELDANVNKEKT